MMTVKSEGLDDVVLPFAVEALDGRGRVVRLGDAVDTIIGRHAYPDAVARVIGEAAALTALLGSSLKFEGRFQLQTKSASTGSGWPPRSPGALRAPAISSAKAISP